MKIVFIGTPKYVVPIIEKLHKNFRENNLSPIVAVVTQRPRPAGRGRKLAYSPIDTWAHSKKIPIYFSPQEIIENDIEADLGILAAYGGMIPQSVIDHFPKGIINVHPSLLPKWRGATPVPAQIIRGEEIGVSIMKLDSQMDHGPILTQFKDELRDTDDSETLLERLFERSANVLVELIPAYIAGKVNEKAQDHSKATFAGLMKKEDGFIDWKDLKRIMRGKSAGGKKIRFMGNCEIEQDAETVHRFVRAMHPWPGVWTMVESGEKEIRMKILSTKVINDKLTLIKVQLEGKRPTNWKEVSSRVIDQ